MGGAAFSQALSDSGSLLGGVRREGREGQMRANDGERTKNGRSQKRGSGTRSVRGIGGANAGARFRAGSNAPIRADHGIGRRGAACKRTESARLRKRSSPEVHGAGRPSLRARVDPGFVAGFDGNPPLRSRIRASVREGISVSAGQSTSHGRLGEERRPNPFSDRGFP